MPLNATDLRLQVEADRTAEIAAVNEKYNRLLEAVAQTYGPFNPRPNTTTPKRTRKRNASTPTDTTTETAAETTDTAPATTVTEDESWRASEAFYDAVTSVRQYLLTKKDGDSMKNIIEATGLTESVAKDVVGHMVGDGNLQKTGVKRGTKYVLTNVSGTT